MAMSLVNKGFQGIKFFSGYFMCNLYVMFEKNRSNRLAKRAENWNGVNTKNDHN